MHWGSAARSAARHLGGDRDRGSVAHATLTVVRLAFDQTLENATGVGAPPSTWPAGERIVEATHKAVCSLITVWLLTG
jgi:hypothetical protein